MKKAVRLPALVMASSMLMSLCSCSGRTSQSGEVTFQTYSGRKKDADRFVEMDITDACKMLDSFVGSNLTTVENRLVDKYGFEPDPNMLRPDRDTYVTLQLSPCLQIDGYQYTYVYLNIDKGGTITDTHIQTETDIPMDVDSCLQNISAAYGTVYTYYEGSNAWMYVYDCGNGNVLGFFYCLMDDGSHLYQMECEYNPDLVFEYLEEY